jgi:hypothetical protein
MNKHVEQKIAVGKHIVVNCIIHNTKRENNTKKKSDKIRDKQ